jgi:hypothetical protein
MNRPPILLSIVVRSGGGFWGENVGSLTVSCQPRSPTTHGTNQFLGANFQKFPTSEVWWTIYFIDSPNPPGGGPACHGSTNFLGPWIGGQG